MTIIHNDICDECMYDGRCKMSKFGLHYPPILACYMFAKVKQTNADRIRQMSDEELAEVIRCQDYKRHDDCFNTPCSECLKEWLKQEVQDETV